MKRADWNKLVQDYERAICKAIDAGEEFARFEAAEERAHDAAKVATDARKAARSRRDCAHREAEAAVMRYGAASAQRALDGGTDEDRAGAADTQEQTS